MLTRAKKERRFNLIAASDEEARKGLIEEVKGERVYRGEWGEGKRTERKTSFMKEEYIALCSLSNTTTRLLSHSIFRIGESNRIVP